MSFRQLSAFGGVVVLTGAGAIWGSRWKNLEVRRAELNKEYANCLEEMRALKEDRLRMQNELKDRQVKNEKMHETVETIWADRMSRYSEVLLDAHSYLAAFPEALGALKGLTNHYRYMGEEMRKFINFDVACSKVHNLSLLLHKADVDGLPGVQQVIRDMFPSEEIIDAACTSVEDIASVKYPRTVAEASVTFAFCMEELERAIETVTRENEARLAEPETKKGMSSEWTKVLNVLKLDSLSKGQRELVAKRAALKKLMTHDLRQLKTEEDVLSAVQYIVQMVEKQNSVLSQRVNDKKNELMLLYFKHPDVKNALSQLELWSNSSTAFLKEQQARDVLHSYATLLSETLVSIQTVQ
ncbi:hypothetical protein AGDE_01311 [Angomonas deanei]|nr:hypothetical protein AGDE_07961 [Angomonas deanei]EPY42612.1 hypothetical protein AGDE_01311 [Angomonas deanei]|eukprot:EPY34348.1 hypothetical protein AGDE_07961 [Angomonas deanei]